MDEVSEKDKENGWWIWLTFIGTMTLLLAILGIAHSYDLIGIRDSLSEEQYLRCMCAVAGIMGCLMAETSVKYVTGLHEGIRAGLRLFLLCMTVVMMFFLVSGVADEDKFDFVGLLVTFILWMAVLFIALYLLHIYKHGTYAIKLNDWLNDTLGGSGKKADKLDAEYREREERSAQGLINIGYNDRTYDKTTLHVHVKAYSMAFTLSMIAVALCAVMAHLTDYNSDERAIACVIAFFIGWFCYMLFIYNEISGAVCKGGIPYREGTEYVLITLAGLTTLYWVIMHVANGKGFDYTLGEWSFYIGAWFVIYALFFILTVAGNRCDGRIFAMFNVDKHRKMMTKKE